MSDRTLAVEAGAPLARGGLARLVERARRGAVAALHQLRWRWRFAAFGARSVLSRPDFLAGTRFIEIGRGVHIWRGARLEAIERQPGAAPRLSIGDGTSIHMYFHCGAAERVEIGRDVLIAGHVYVTDHDHDLGRPGTSARRSPRLDSAPTVIEDECWLGEGCKVLKGVRLGRGAVVGAGAVVTRDVAPYTLVVGVPARPLRRFDPVADEWVAVEADAGEPR